MIRAHDAHKPGAEVLDFAHAEVAAGVVAKPVQAVHDAASLHSNDVAAPRTQLQVAPFTLAQRIASGHPPLRRRARLATSADEIRIGTQCTSISSISRPSAAVSRVVAAHKAHKP